MQSLISPKFGEPSIYELRQSEIPTISKPTDILIKVEAASINAHDVIMASGRTKMLQGQSLTNQCQPMLNSPSLKTYSPPTSLPNRLRLRWHNPLYRFINNFSPTRRQSLRLQHLRRHSIYPSPNRHHKTPRNRQSSLRDQHNRSSISPRCSSHSNLSSPPCRSISAWWSTRQDRLHPRSTLGCRLHSTSNREAKVRR